MPVLVSTADFDTSDANLPAVVTYDAVAGKSHIITGIAFGYDGEPTGGLLTVENGSGQIVFRIPVTTKGTGFIPFPKSKQGGVNTALIITLAAGGSGVKGYVSVLNHWTE
jgi:hypothetical protein